ncbi:MAG: TetR/AcrR family transcriptional regulator [Cyanobacteria bacterium P01_H01_bin.121]
MPSKLTKAEQTRRTRRAILDRARSLFAAQGYAATGTEELIHELGLTRGALYHQFGDKLGVFRAVIEEVYGEITSHINARVMQVEDPWEQLVLGCKAFLEIAQREELRRLIYIEAPAVLAADTLAEFDQPGFSLLLASIQGLHATGQLNTPHAEGFAHSINGALNELAAWVAQSSESDRLQIAQSLVETLLAPHRVQ